MGGTNGCNTCYKDWNLCQCARVLDAGEMALTARVKAIGGVEVYRQEWRAWREKHLQCLAPESGGKCVVADTNRPCTAACRYFVAE